MKTNKLIRKDKKCLHKMFDKFKEDDKMVERDETRGFKLDIKFASLKKNIRKYEEHVNKCDIHATNVLAESIGADILSDYTQFSKITGEQKQELKKLEEEFARHMDNLKRCRCIRKIEK